MGSINERVGQHFGVIKPFLPVTSLGISRAWNIWELDMGLRIPVFVP